MPCFYSVFWFWVLSMLVALTLIHSNWYIEMGFRAPNPKIWYLGRLNNLSWRNLRKQQKQEGHSDLHSPSPLKQIIKLSCKRYLPYTYSKGGSLSPKMRGYQLNLNKQALLNFFQLTTPISYSLTYHISLQPSIFHQS